MIAWQVIRVIRWQQKRDVLRFRRRHFVLWRHLVVVVVVGIGCSDLVPSEPGPIYTNSLEIGEFVNIPTVCASCRLGSTTTRAR